MPVRPASPRPARTRALRRLLVGVLAAVAGLGLAAPASAAPSDARAEAGEPTPLVLVGVTGVRWDDVTSVTTPALWGLSRTGSVGLVAARSVTNRSCPADGWLAVSSGNRASDLPAEDRTCRTLEEPSADGLVPGWDDYLASARAQSYGAVPGLLGDTLAAAGTAVTGIGPGAAIALADRDGRPVGTHEERPESRDSLRYAVSTALDASPLVVVDAGTVRDPGYATRDRSSDEAVPPDDDEAPTEPTSEVDPDTIADPARDEQVQAVDARVGAALEAARAHDATVLVVSLADSGRVALQLAAATGTAPNGQPYDASMLTSGATRQQALIQTLDVAPTLLDALDLTAPALVGATIVPSDGPVGAAGRRVLLADIQAESTYVGRVAGSFSTRLVIVQALFFVAAAVVLTRAGRTDRGRMRPGLRVLQVAGIALGTAPVASFLVGVVPWWRWGVAGFWVALLGVVAVVTAAALLGPWRRRILGPAGVVAAVTVVVLLVDACTGSNLVIDSPMGAHRTLAARFYGMSNQAFALVLAGGVLLAVAIADELLRRHRRRAALWTVIGLGLVVAVVDGAPGLGSDFGGPPAILLAFGMLAVAVTGRKVSWRTLLLVLGVGVLVIGGFAVLDWLRPPDARTHLGRFLATVLDGGLWDVLWRKVSVNLKVLTNWRYLVLAVGGVALTWVVMTGGRTRRGSLMGSSSPLAGLPEAVPLLRTGVAALGTGLLVGFLMNDSGIVVPATGIAMAVPCLVAAAAQFRLADQPAAAEPPPALSGASGTASAG